MTRRFQQQPDYPHKFACSPWTQAFQTWAEVTGVAARHRRSCDRPSCALSRPEPIKLMVALNLHLNVNSDLNGIFRSYTYTFRQSATLGLQEVIRCASFPSSGSREAPPRAP